MLDTQIGGCIGGGTELASHIFRAFQQFCLASGIAFLALFFDLTSAFDRALRCLIVQGVVPMSPSPVFLPTWTSHMTKSKPSPGKDLRPLPLRGQTWQLDFKPCSGNLFTGFISTLSESIPLQSPREEPNMGGPWPTSCTISS